MKRATVAWATALAVSGAWGSAIADAARAEEPGRLVADGAYRMGTLFEITLVARDEAVARRQIAAAFDATRELEDRISVYREDSDIRRLNAAAGGDPVQVDPRVTRILERSVRCSRMTRGAFDVTVGPLVEMWIEAARRDRAPSDEDVAAVRPRVGASRLEISADGSARLARPGMAVDLGGIGKGFALDLLVPGLRAQGVRDALLNFGQSSVWALGSPPGSRGWRLLVRNPDSGFAGVVTLRDTAFSVSSSLGQWSQIGGRRYGHVVDPRTGLALTRGRQAAVVAPDATLAEAWSTALLVLPAEEGIDLVEATAGTEALLVYEDGRSVATSGWSAATSFEPLPVDRRSGDAVEPGE